MNQARGRTAYQPPTAASSCWQNDKPQVKGRMIPSSWKGEKKDFRTPTTNCKATWKVNKIQVLGPSLNKQKYCFPWNKKEPHFLQNSTHLLAENIASKQTGFCQGRDVKKTHSSAADTKGERGDILPLGWAYIRKKGSIKLAWYTSHQWTATSLVQGLLRGSCIPSQPLLGIFVIHFNRNWD